MEALPGVEIPRQEDNGKCVALIEAESESAILSRISEIEAMPGVISATLVYHQIDE